MRGQREINIAIQLGILVNTYPNYIPQKIRNMELKSET